LSYKTATQNGYTDEDGIFKYKNGETIEFKLGTLSLGSVTAGNLITPYTMAGDVNISNPSNKATNIALLLQNFDVNRSDTSILDLANLKDYNFSDINLSATPASIEAKLITLLATGSFQLLIDQLNHNLKDATAVNNDMKNFIQQNYLKYDKKFTLDYVKGKTLYAKYVAEGSVEPLVIPRTQISFTDENQNPPKILEGLGVSHTMDIFRVVDGKLYQYTVEDGHYNDGVNVFSIVSVDDEKITTIMKVDIRTYNVELYFSNPTGN
jgi:hypothetical protein